MKIQIRLEFFDRTLKCFKTHFTSNIFFTFHFSTNYFITFVKVSLKTTKPKTADQPSQFDHVKIAEKSSHVQAPVQKPPVPKEQMVPAADQVALKPAFKPKDGAAGPMTKLEEVALKPATILIKTYVDNFVKIDVRYLIKTVNVSIKY